MECQESGDNTNHHRSSWYAEQNFKRYVEQLEMGQMTSLLQKTCVLGTAKIIRKTLDT